MHQTHIYVNALKLICYDLTNIQIRQYGQEELSWVRIMIGFRHIIYK